MLMSAAIPGTGEMYAGNPNRGAVFLAADAVALFTYYHSGNEVDRLKQNYEKYAYVQAGIPLHRSSDYYTLLHRWKSSADYNAHYEMLARNYFLLLQYDPEGYNAYISTHQYLGEDAWDWQTDRNWNTYKSLRRQHNAQLMNQKLALGAIIANRIISAVDASYQVKLHNRALHASLYINPDFTRNGASINCCLEY